MNRIGSNDKSEAIRTGEEILARHSRTFRMASLWLPRQTRREVAVLYAVCRLIDDLADEEDDEQVARRHLEELSREFDGEESPRPLVAELLSVARRRDLDVAIIQELIAGVTGDLQKVRIESDEELIRYCYRVAGTVGLMMCTVLGVDDKAALPHAIDLGIAMQLTNICRDVREDARRGRVYLPARRLGEMGLCADDILDESANMGALAAVVDDLLELADRYYESGQRGMGFIPARSRFAIIVAGRTYRAIGLRLRRRNCDVMAGRVVVPTPAKMMWLVVSMGRWVKSTLTRPQLREVHQKALHSALVGLPGSRTQ